MAVRGVYTREEQKMISDYEEAADSYVGWMGEEPKVGCTYPVFHRVASKDLIENMARASDYWNPLWRDEDYARKTRWGGIIAPPFFQNCITHGGSQVLPLNIPTNVSAEWWFAGEDYEFFQPIRVNDSFKAWRSRPRIIDITSLDGNGPRKLRLITSVLKFYNQRDELVSLFTRHFNITLLPPREEKKVEIAPDYRYTKEELEYIDRIADEEEIRGADIRYWEDVSVGDELRPVILGPTTVWDSVVEIAGFGVSVLPMREVRKKTPDVTILDPVTGVTHKTIELHLSDRTAQLRGSPKACVIMVASEHLQGRLITNWMGDDGFLKRFYWRMFGHGDIGDTFISRGKVIKKYVENGEHLVDLSVWTESFKGDIVDAALATASLFSREDI